MKYSDNQYIINFLNKNKINPTYQRIKIYEYLDGNKNHPTVEIIYNDLVNVIPTLSKTTVYNTMKLFSEKGIVHEIMIDGNENKYDSNISNHGHFKCNTCNRIFDFNLELSNLECSISDDFEINDFHVYFKGKCKRCK